MLKKKALNYTLVSISNNFFLWRRIIHYNITGSKLLCFLLLLLLFLVSLCVTQSTANQGIHEQLVCCGKKMHDFEMPSLQVQISLKKIPAVMCLGLGSLSLRGSMTFLVTTSDMFFA